MKSGRCINTTLTENQIVKHDTKSILEIIKVFINLGSSLLKKFPNPPSRNITQFFSDYCRKLTISESFKVVSTAEDVLFKLSKILRQQNHGNWLNFGETLKGLGMNFSKA